MTNNDYILAFKKKVVKQLKNKNFADNQRLPFYQALTKIAQNFVKTLDNENEKNIVLNYVKNFIINMTHNETLTPQKALQSFKEEVETNKTVKITKEKTPRNKKALKNKLFNAINQNNIQMVSNCLNQGVNINEQDEFQNTPLIRALGKKKPQIAELLINNGADVNMSNFGGNIPLILAAKEGYTQIAELLIKKGADVNAKGMLQETALTLACTSGQIDTVKLLIENGADIHQKDIQNKTAYELLFNYIQTNHINKKDMPAFKNALKHLKETHSFKEQIKFWFKSLKDGLKR